jgi:NAD(P)-dependent dehydrogenase (short-subunit alcohol dehydrogenase family)
MKFVYKTYMKTALVTGSAKRLGRKIAIDLASDGWNVIIHYHKTKPDAALKKITNIEPVKADLLDFNQLPKLFQHGKVDLLINSASIYEKKKFLNSTEKDFDDNFDIHVKAAYFLSQYFAKQTKKGHIINMVDAFTVSNKSVYFPYLLSKKALLDLSRMLAVELAPNIRVNSIMPGVMKEFTDNLNPAFVKSRKKNLPQGDFASAEDVSRAIKFLNDSSLTGQEIYVDSGEHLL